MLYGCAVGCTVRVLPPTPWSVPLSRGSVPPDAVRARVKVTIGVRVRFTVAVTVRARLGVVLQGQGYVGGYC